MEYALYLIGILFTVLLYNIIKKTVARSLFEALYMKALKKRSNRQAARFWGSLYYSSFDRNERRAVGIRDMRQAIENDIESHHFQVN